MKQVASLAAKTAAASAATVIAVRAIAWFNRRVLGNRAKIRP